MSHSTYWSQLLFKLVSIPFLILIVLVIVSQAIALRRYATGHPSALYQPELHHFIYKADYEAEFLRSQKQIIPLETLSDEHHA